MGRSHGGPVILGLGHSRCVASVGNRGGDVPTSGVVVRAVGQGVVNVGVSGVRLGQLGEVGLVDKLGRAGVYRSDQGCLPSSRGFHVLVHTSCGVGVLVVRSCVGRRQGCWVLAIVFVGDVAVAFVLNITRPGGVAVWSTRTAI